MRTVHLLDALFPQSRQAILSVLLLQPERSWHLRELGRRLDVQPSSLQRELAALVEAGILTRRRDGNRVCFQAEVSCPIYTELRGILEKTSGLTDVVKDALEPFAEKIDWAFIYGSVARSEERATSDVDVLVIGRIGLVELVPALRVAERRLERPVNASVYTRQEFTAKLRAGHHFIRTVMKEPKLAIRGDLHELASIAQDESRPPSRHQQK